MKNIIRIFLADMKGLCTNFFALVIAIALCFLPALYAWFNIYANWDPYANTGNIKIAVCSLDEGWEREDGEKENMGQTISDGLKEKDSIHWVFLDDEKETVDGVRSGEYYAAVVIEKDFTYSMYNAIADNFTNPKITYYENEKKNAVATKITDTAVGTLQQSINEQYIKAVTETVMEITNGVSEDMEESDVVDQFIEKLHMVSENLDGYSAMIDSFRSGNDNLADASEGAVDSISKAQGDITAANGDLENAKADLESTKNSYATFSKDMNAELDNLKKSIDEMNEVVNDPELKKSVKNFAEKTKKMGETADALDTNLKESITKYEGNVKECEQIINHTGSTPKEIADAAARKKVYESFIEVYTPLEKQVALIAVAKDINPDRVADKTVAQLEKEVSKYYESVVEAQNIYNNQVSPQVLSMLNSTQETISNVEVLLINLNSTMGNMLKVFDGVSDSLGTLNLSMEELQKVINNTNDKIKEALEKIESANEEDRLDVIMSLLSGDPEAYSEFFSQPVVVNENFIYEIKNYGSGVAPFYTTLALWVGMTILVSMIKVHANKSDAINPKPYQLFFGRYLMFFLLSQIQALVIVLGDLYLLKIQCLHPLAFWGAAAVASFAFSMLVYALTISFGDIGKALAVVVMVIQIAGSGGTYPIDALPAFFRAVYIFFPFPYAIDAMRECIGGMYQNTYSICLFQLAIFIVAGLVIGLFVRIPFMAVNHYIEKRMEDTEML